MIIIQLKKAIKTAGSQTALAKAIGVKQQHIWNWLNRDKTIPAEYVIRLEKAVGISRHLLRPDIYGKEE